MAASPSVPTPGVPIPGVPTPRTQWLASPTPRNPRPGVPRPGTATPVSLCQMSPAQVFPCHQSPSGQGTAMPGGGRGPWVTPVVASWGTRWPGKGPGGGHGGYGWHGQGRGDSTVPSQGNPWGKRDGDPGGAGTGGVGRDWARVPTEAVSPRVPPALCPPPGRSRLPRGEEAAEAAAGESPPVTGCLLGPRVQPAGGRMHGRWGGSRRPLPYLQPATPWGPATPLGTCHPPRHATPGGCGQGWHRKGTLCQQRVGSVGPPRPCPPTPAVLSRRGRRGGRMGNPQAGTGKGLTPGWGWECAPSPGNATFGGPPAPCGQNVRQVPSPRPEHPRPGVPRGVAAPKSPPGCH